MARFYKKRTQNLGQAPGSLIFIGTKRMEHTLVHLIEYNKETVDERLVEDLDHLFSVPLPDQQDGSTEPSETMEAGRGDVFTQNKKVTWLNVDGVHDDAFMEKVGNCFNIHPLALEDIMNTGQRAKFTDFEDFIFCSLKMLHQQPNNGPVVTEQLSFILKPNLLISFQEQAGDVLDAVRFRIRNNKGRVRGMGADYLLYALVDTVVDHYIYLIEQLGQNIEDLELRVLDKPDEETLSLINTYKRELNFISKVIRPVRELVREWSKNQSPLIHKKTYAFLNDLLDITTHAVETIDTYRDLLNDYLNLYHTAAANRLNDVMKVLTIFSAVFIPITFLAGVYGMNFDYLPELQWRYAYPTFWALALLIAGGLLYYFRRKRWL